MGNPKLIHSVVAAASALVLAYPVQAQVAVSVSYTGDNSRFTIKNNYSTPLTGITITGAGFGGNSTSGTVSIPTIAGSGSFVYAFTRAVPAFHSDFDEFSRGQVAYTLKGTVAGGPVTLAFSPNSNATGGFVPFLGNGSTGEELDANVPLTRVASGFAVVAATAPVARPPQAYTIHVVDLGAIFSTWESGVPMVLAQHDILLDVAHSTTRDVGGRLFRLRAGYAVDETAGGSPGPSGDLTNRGADGKTLSSGKDYKTEPTEPFRRFELFGEGDFNAFNINDIGQMDGFESQVEVATAGLEFRADRHITLGVAGSYVSSFTHISDSVGTVNINGGAVTAYISGVWQGFYVDALYSYGQFAETTTRETLIGRSARGDADSHNHSVEFSTGFNFRWRGLLTGPLATVQYVNGELDAYNETNGGVAALHFGSQAYDSLISRVGWQLSVPIETHVQKIKFTPQIRASWDRENLDDSQTLGLSLQQSPFATITGIGAAKPKISSGGKFSTSASTVHPGRDYLDLGAGLAIQLGDRASVILDYETQIFRANATAHLGSVKISWLF